MHMNDSEVDICAEKEDQVWALYGHVRIQVHISVFDWPELIQVSHRGAEVEALWVTPSRCMHCVFRKILKISFTFLISKKYRVLISRHDVSNSDQMVYIFLFLWQQLELG